MEDGTSKAPGYCKEAMDDQGVQWEPRADCEVRQILDRIADK